MSCGPGTTLAGKTCALGSLDGGLGLGPDAGATREGGAAAIAPTFAGASAAAPASPTAVLVAWSPATEADTPALDMRYRVYLSPAKSAIDYSKPAATTVGGATSFFLTGLNSATTYSVAVRALDPAGNADANVVVKSVTPAADTAPPTFAGVTGASPAGPAAAKLTWAAASDDHTPAGALVYFVYVSNQLSSFVYSTPTLITDPGVTSVTVPYLYDPSLVYSFTVRARDAAGNIDANTATATSRGGADTTAPQFAGCASAIADSAGSAVVTWPLATDDGTPQSLITYDIFDANQPGGFTLSKPALSVQGVGLAEVTGLSQATTWHFVVRARDFVGNEDQNLVDCVTKTSTDPTPPTFAGCSGVVVASDARTATFSWSPATDPVTSPDKIVYDVFQGLAPGAEDYSKPIATSDPGATSVFVSDSDPRLHALLGGARPRSGGQSRLEHRGGERQHRREPERAGPGDVLVGLRSRRMPCARQPAAEPRAHARVLLHESRRRQLPRIRRRAAREPRRPHDELPLPEGLREPTSGGLPDAGSGHGQRLDARRD